jgi:hypothetical protein
LNLRSAGYRSELFSVDGSFRHAQPAFPPDDSSDFLDKVFLGWANRCMLSHKRAEKGLVFGFVFPGKHVYGGFAELVEMV